MFFLKDLEAVTTNFYHDLWQSTRLHTPKVCYQVHPLQAPQHIPESCLEWLSPISTYGSRSS